MPKGGYYFDDLSFNRGERIDPKKFRPVADIPDEHLALLRDHGRAVLIGRRTYGKGSVQTVLPLSAGGAIKLTTSRYYTPSGATIHEKGLQPDIELREAAGRRRLAGAAPGAAPLPERDEGVRVALEWLKGPAAARLAAHGAS